MPNKRKQLKRERLFKKKSIHVSPEDYQYVAVDGYDRLLERKLNGKENSRLIEHVAAHNFEVFIDDPFTTVILNLPNGKKIIGNSKRMPDDIPDDNIGITIAVSRVLKQLNNDLSYFDKP